MNEISIWTDVLSGATIIPNLFIEQYMPRANGEFVKVYLYLLRSLSQCPPAFGLAKGADALDCTEKDILRALNYWAREGLVSLSFDEHKKLSGIRLLPLQENTADAGKPNTKSEALSVPKTPALRSYAAMTLDEQKRLMQDEEFRQLLFIAEQYLGRTLSPTDSEKIAYFYERLHLSFELIEYLIEYCVSREKRSIRYIESIALSWAEKGITTVEEAKKESSLYQKSYFTILKALGIQNRNPVESEIAIMNTWEKEYGFTLDVITEACSRTVLQIGQPSFQYADRILQDWKKKGVRHLADIAPLDAAHKKKKTPKTAPTKSQAANRFNNFHQRNYDFDEYERQLLNR